MANIDTENNVVSNKENFDIEKIPIGNMEHTNNNSKRIENIDIKENSFTNIERFNSEDNENVNAIRNLIFSQIKNIESLLQILESSIKLFESTFDCYNSTRGSLASQNQDLSFYILRHMQKLKTSMKLVRFSASHTKDRLESLDAFINARFKNLKSLFSLDPRRLAYTLEKTETDTLNAYYMISDIAELCRLILTDDPSFLEVLFNMPVIDCD